jgi:hypothetical protein
MNLTLKNNEIPIEIEDEVNFQHLRTSWEKSVFARWHAERIYSFAVSSWAWKIIRSATLAWIWCQCRRRWQGEFVSTILEFETCTVELVNVIIRMERLRCTSQHHKRSQKSCWNLGLSLKPLITLLCTYKSWWKFNYKTLKTNLQLLFANLIGQDSQTPLQIAMHDSHLAVTKLLLYAGAEWPAGENDVRLQ